MVSLKKTNDKGVWELETDKKEYRSRLDIIAAILRASMGGATKTRLMYTAYLSYKQRELYVSWMEDKKLLERTHNVYMLSKSGQEFLNTYEKLTKQLDNLIPRDKDAKTGSSGRAARRLKRNEQSDASSTTGSELR